MLSSEVFNRLRRSGSSSVELVANKLAWKQICGPAHQLCIDSLWRPVDRCVRLSQYSTHIYLSNRKI
jgi:hypothetical protein